MVSKIASRYARAFYESLGTEAKVRKAIEELSGFAEVIDSNVQLQRVLTTDLFTEEVKREVIEDLTKKANLSDETTRLLVVVNSMHRMASLKGMIEGLRLQLLAHSEVVPLQVDSAAALTDGEKELVEKKFSKLLGKKVEASYGERADLIGGVRVTAGSRTYDGSISGGLSQLEEQLIGGSI